MNVILLVEGESGAHVDIAQKLCNNCYRFISRRRIRLRGGAVPNISPSLNPLPFQMSILS